MPNQPPASADTNQVSRRIFLGAATAAAGLATTGLRADETAAATPSTREPVKPIGVGFVGVGNRGSTHIRFVQNLQARGLAQPVAVCDAYLPRARAAAEASGAKIHRTCAELLDDPRVDAVCIATPDRHHAIQAIEAVRAGKDVFVEKPLTHWSQFELAQQLAREAEQHHRIVQVGTQFVADEAYEQVAQLIQDDVVGKILHAQCGYFRRGDWGERMNVPDANAKPGEELDWNAFQGDAPPAEFSIARFFQWRLFWDYAGGPATDLLYHAFTPVFRVLNLTYPTRVMCGGGTFQYDREVPDQCNIVADYEGGPSVVLMNSLSNAAGIDTVLRGTKGTISWKQINDPSSKGVRIVADAKNAKEIFIPWKGMGDPQRLWDDFVDCIKTRRQPISPVSLAARVQLPLTMAVLSHQKSAVMTFDEQTQRIRASS
jgi:predicted dehydrogenase